MITSLLSELAQDCEWELNAFGPCAPTFLGGKECSSNATKTIRKPAKNGGLSCGAPKLVKLCECPGKIKD